MTLTSLGNLDFSVCVYVFFVCFMGLITCSVVASLIVLFVLFVLFVSVALIALVALFLFSNPIFPSPFFCRCRVAR